MLLIFQKRTSPIRLSNSFSMKLIPNHRDILQERTFSNGKTSFNSNKCGLGVIQLSPYPKYPSFISFHCIPFLFFRSVFFCVFSMFHVICIVYSVYVIYRNTTGNTRKIAPYFHFLWLYSNMECTRWCTVCNLFAIHIALSIPLRVYVYCYLTIYEFVNVTNCSSAIP